jgi:hypothetical protein
VKNGAPKILGLFDVQKVSKTQKYAKLRFLFYTVKSKINGILCKS